MNGPLPDRAYWQGGETVKYDDPNMEHYFRSLPPPVQRLIERSGADIGSPGELMLIGEHFKISYGYQEPERK